MMPLLSNAPDYIGLVLVSLWIVFRMLRLVALRENAGPIAFSIILIAFAAWPGNPVFAGLTALFAPFGVLLPALCARSMARSLGLRVMPFHWTDLFLFLVLHGILISASSGLLPSDIYAYGYAPVGAMALALITCIWGFLRENLFMPGVALIATLLWVADIGSSNAFDNFAHLTLWPLALIALPRAILRP